jgi:hypothetical protein
MNWNASKERCSRLLLVCAALLASQGCATCVLWGPYRDDMKLKTIEAGGVVEQVYVQHVGSASAGMVDFWILCRFSERSAKRAALEEDPVWIGSRTWPEKAARFIRAIERSVAEEHGPAAPAKPLVLRYYDQQDWEGSTLVGGSDPAGPLTFRAWRPGKAHPALAARGIGPPTEFSGWIALLPEGARPIPVRYVATKRVKAYKHLWWTLPATPFAVLVDIVTSPFQLFLISTMHV